ncbi:hypothetical protein KAR28_02785 [Candidatus Parcubacteria bacterium]|nr:hypothetical protein [Candidatus Parcubacteria bacterium]
MKKKNIIIKVTIVVSLLLASSSVFYYYVYYLPKLENIRKEVNYKEKQELNYKLLTQIIAIENRLEGVVDKTESCFGVLANYKVEEATSRCLSANEISKWARSTPFYPELSEIKKELLVLSDLLDEYVFEIVLYKNQDADWRGEMDKRILIQETKVREAILKIERDYNLDRNQLKIRIRKDN